MSKPLRAVLLEHPHPRSVELRRPGRCLHSGQSSDFLTQHEVVDRLPPSYEHHRILSRSKSDVACRDEIHARREAEKAEVTSEVRARRFVERRDRFIGPRNPAESKRVRRDAANK